MAANAMPIYKKGGGCIGGFKLFGATQKHLHFHFHMLRSEA